MMLRTMGGLALENSSFRRPKPLLLLAYLALEGPTERRYLSELFWRGAASPRRSLATAMWQVRAEAPGALGADDVRVWSEVPCDAALMMRALEARDWLRAIVLHGGVFLEGCGVTGIGVELEEWIHSTREMLEEGVRDALLALGEAAAHAGRFQEAGEWAERARAACGSAVPAPGEIARTYTLLLASGRGALGRLREEAREFAIGLPPTLQAARQTLRGQTGSREGAALPVRSTPFVGRRREIAEIMRLLEASDARVVSILGAGGVGKTRLALEVASAEAERGAWDGVHFIGLEALRDPHRLASAIGAAFEITIEEHRDAVPSLRRALGASAHLVVLDNFEHLLEGASLLSDLARACPGLCLLVTSRARLDLDEEQVILLDGMPVPGEEVANAESALLCDSVTLFVQRARRARPDFVLDDASVAPVLTICRLVGGMPLALEMAAAWTRVMRCEEIATELATSLDLLESSRRDRPARHRSIRVVFEHSWRLLNPLERRMATALSVFRGGFRRAAAERVAGASPLRLASLLDRSLVSWNGAERYGLHPLWQQFLAEKGDELPEERSTAEARHTAHYLEMLAGMGDAFPHRDAGAAAATIEADLANVLVAWERAAARGQDELLEDAVQALGWFFLLRGRCRQGLAWAETPAGVDASTRLTLRRLVWQGEYLKELGRQRDATDRIDRAIHLAEKLGAGPELAHALRLAGFIYLRYDPPAKERVIAAYRRSIELYHELGNAWGEALMLGNLAYELDDPEAFAAMLAKALRLAREHEEPLALAMNLGYLAKLELYCRGNYLAARDAAEESVAHHEATGFDFHLAHTLLTLGDAHLSLGNATDAHRVAMRALDLCDGFQGGARGMLRGAVRTLQGHVARAAGHPSNATARYGDALRLLREEPRNELTVWSMGMSLDGLARLAVQRGRPAEACARAEEALALARGFAQRGELFLPAGIESMCLVRLAEAEMMAGRYEVAETHVRSGLATARKRGRVPATLEALATLAELYQRQMRRADAAELFTAVGHHAATPFATRARARAAAEELSGLFPMPAGGDIAPERVIARHGGWNASPSDEVL